MRLREFVTPAELASLSHIQELALRRLPKRRTRKPPFAAAPKPLPKQKPAKAAPQTAKPYQPIKGVKSLPPTTLAVATKALQRPEPLKPPPQAAKIPASMQPLPSGQIAMIQSKTDPVAQKIAQQERG